MNERLRGLFLLEPPPGGLERLRRALNPGSPPAREFEFLPWVATACLVVVIAAPLLLGRMNASRWNAGATERIVQSVLGQEPEPWRPLPGGEGDVRIHLARPTHVGTAAD